MNLISRIFSLAVLFFSLNSSFAVAMEPEAEPVKLRSKKRKPNNVRSVSPKAKRSKNLNEKKLQKKMTLMQCLKQDMVPQGHGLHCGYYALWHALCGLDSDLKKRICNQKSFFKELGKWESSMGWARFNKEPRNIFEKSKYALSLISVKVDNLEPNELDLLIEEHYKSFSKQISVIPSVNYLEHLSKGLVSDEKLFSCIQAFNENFTTQAFIINTGNDKGVRLKGTNHWITIVLSGNKDTVTFSIYDSGYVPDQGRAGRKQKDAEYKKIMAYIYELFITKDVELLQVRCILNDVLPAMNKYLEASEQNPESWAYVSMLEEYFLELFVLALENCEPSKSRFDEEQRINLKNNIKKDGRESFGMEPLDCSGVINPGYVHRLQNVSIPSSFDELKDDAAREMIKQSLFESGHAYEQENLRALAAGKIVQAYDVAQEKKLSDATFMKALQELKIPQDVIDQSGIIPDQV